MSRWGRAAAFLFAAAMAVGPVPVVVAQTATTTGDCSPIAQNVGGDLTIICNFPDSNRPKFRISYYRVGGLGLSFLLDGLLSPEWAERLGGQQAIIPNAVSQEADRFLDRFANPVAGSGVYGSISSNVPDYYVDFAEYARQVDPTITTIESDAGDVPQLDPQRWRAYFGGGRTNALLVPDVEAMRHLLGNPSWPDQYGIVYGGRDKDYPPSFEDDALFPAPLMWRWLSQADLDTFEQNYRLYIEAVLRGVFPESGDSPVSSVDTESVDDVVGGLWSQELLKDIDSIRYLTREGIPDRFMHVEGWQGAHYGWSFTSTPRDFQLLIAVLENVSDGPIEVGEFSFRQINHMTLRLSEDTDRALENAHAFRAPIYPLGVLRPGEKIVLPVRIELPQSVFDEDMRERFEGAAWQGRKILQTVRARGDAPIGILDANNSEVFSKPASSFPEQQVPDIVERYEYGPAWRIDSVVVDGAEFAFRRHNPNNFVMIASFEVGSCPHAFTYQPDGQIWLSEGHFLYGAVLPEKKRTEEKVLEHFKGRVSVRELEHEIAFLDMIQLKLTDADGNVSMHEPATAALRAVDGKEVRLAYGQGIELDFGLEEEDWRGKTASLVAAGYYIPFTNPRLFAGGGSD